MSEREGTHRLSTPAVPLPLGRYDQIISHAVARLLQGLDPSEYRCQTNELDPAEAPRAIAQHVERLVASSLAQRQGDAALELRTRVLTAVAQTLAESLGTDWLDQVLLTEPPRRLLTIERESSCPATASPDTPLARSAILTGTRLDPSLAGQLRKEIATADRVDILCSFIRWSGLRLILDELKQLTAQPHPDGPRLRVITTSYMGATDPRAVEAIRDLPHTRVRVSYDTTRTRLHACERTLRRHQT
jgi:hypothetical protein